MKPPKSPGTWTYPLYGADKRQFMLAKTALNKAAAGGASEAELNAMRPVYLVRGDGQQQGTFAFVSGSEPLAVRLMEQSNRYAHCDSCAFQRGPFGWACSHTPCAGGLYRHAVIDPDDAEGATVT